MGAGVQQLVRAVESLGSPRILVVGDLILDRYVEGTAGRVSPEAPVLVFEWEGERFRLGGACNVASNLVQLGAQTAVLGALGSDASGEKLRELLKNDRIDTELLVEDPARPTTTKTRYVSRTAQVLRVDQEKRAGVGGEAEQRILGHLAVRPFPFQAILLSDATPPATCSRSFRTCWRTCAPIPSPRPWTRIPATPST